VISLAIIQAARKRVSRVGGRLSLAETQTVRHPPTLDAEVSCRQEALAFSADLGHGLISSNLKNFFLKFIGLFFLLFLK
jgi:hypothetical protein